MSLDIQFSSLRNNYLSHVNTPQIESKIWNNREVGEAILVKNAEEKPKERSQLGNTNTYEDQDQSWRQNSLARENILQQIEIDMSREQPERLLEQFEDSLQQQQKSRELGQLQKENNNEKSNQNSFLEIVKDDRDNATNFSQEQNVDQKIDENIINTVQPNIETIQNNTLLTDDKAKLTQIISHRYTFSEEQQKQQQEEGGGGGGGGGGKKLENTSQKSILKLGSMNISKLVKQSVDLNKIKKMAKEKQDESAANLYEDEYFGEDNEKKKSQRDKFIQPSTISRLRDHNASWNTLIFLEIFWYHVLNYLLIGPLINLLYYQKRILMRNLQFYGNTRAFYIQLAIYIFNFLIVVIYLSADNSNIFPFEVISTFIILIFRCFVIACKYATLHPDKIRLYREYVLGKDETDIDYYLLNWNKQDDFIIYKESYNALQRAEVDSSTFYLSQKEQY